MTVIWFCLLCSLQPSLWRCVDTREKICFWQGGWLPVSAGQKALIIVVQQQHRKERERSSLCDGGIWRGEGIADQKWNGLIEVWLLERNVGTWNITYVTRTTVTECLVNIDKQRHNSFYSLHSKHCLLTTILIKLLQTQFIESYNPWYHLALNPT